MENTVKEEFVNPFDKELNEKDLKHVSGGAITHSIGEAFYEFNGNYSGPKDYNHIYLCPICGNTVHWGSWSRWYCDPCNTSWYDKSKLLANLSK